MNPFNHYLNRLYAKHEHTLWCTGCGSEITLNAGDGERLQYWLSVHWDCKAMIRDTSDPHYQAALERMMGEATKAALG